ncbi:39S ribosomal protein L32, mitochondrial isoform X2 [Copidosoma floridanum]|uniref:39S ribosomal protein L32, mitochondrial isoform X2 n=1 Tax=Copidosoma floridanum TaxID=29053 RepID=UPI0006C9DF4B|nr:39S ribosomal protein L32, mitochondrial isoform X2 [Copidosoma floridanum]
MAYPFVSLLREAALKLEQIIVCAVLRKFHPGIGIVVPFEDALEARKSITVQGVWKQGILWGVPKHRRNITTRHNRKFGWPDYIWKPMVPKNNLIMCRVCGHFHESQIICRHCYEKVRNETTEIQKVMEKELKLDSMENEIIVSYEGEDYSKSEKFWKRLRKCFLFGELIG